MCVTVLMIVLLCINFCNAFMIMIYLPSLLLFSIAVRTFNTEVSAEVWWRGTVQQLVAMFTVVA